MSKDRELLRDIQAHRRLCQQEPTLDANEHQRRLDVAQSLNARIDARLAEPQPIYDDAMSRRLWLMETEKPQGEAGGLADELMHQIYDYAHVAHEFYKVADGPNTDERTKLRDKANTEATKLRIRLVAALRAEGTQDALKAGDAVMDGFYVQDSRTYVGNDMLFWQRGGGYTTNLDDAEVFTKEVAWRMNRSRPTDTPWPVKYIRAKSRPAVDMQYVSLDEASRTPRTLAALQQQVAELKDELDMAQCSWQNLLDEKKAAESERDALRKDAERYRWLRERLDAADFAYGSPPRYVLTFAMPNDMEISPDLDASLDAAMQAKEK